MNIFLSSQDYIYSIILLLIFSTYFRLILQFINQTWIITIAHTSTIFILPIITYIITKVISGNIALSLGMVGALSIVRFRNPVRSPLELTVYFGAITMGISASVSIKWLYFLFFSLNLAIFALIILNLFFSKILKRPFFISSFSEGNSLSTLSVVTNIEIKQLEENINLISKSKLGNEISYTLASNEFLTLKNLNKEILSNHKVISLQLKK